MSLLRALVFVLAFLSAATAVSLPWMLGDEYAAACFTQEKDDLPIPPGFYLRWNTTPSDKMRATQASNIAYTVVISDDFWKAASNKVLLGAKCDFYQNACRAENPECTLSTPSQCCVWHANVHSCLSSAFPSSRGDRRRRRRWRLRRGVLFPTHRHRLPCVLEVFGELAAHGKAPQQ